MANCPKCHEHLKLTDWKQHCPHCGANLVIYDLQERLMQDADIAEVQHYHFQKKVDRLKGAFVGSPLAIVRIFTTLLPIGALFLALINAKIKEPFAPYEGGVSFLTIYSNIDGLTGALGNLFEGSLLFLGIALVLLLVSILMIVVKFALLTLACSPKGKQRNTVLEIITIVASLGAVIAFMIMPDNDVISGSIGIGGYLYVVLQIAAAVVDILCLKKGIEIHHAQCYVGGIPIEEYFQMQEKGMTTEEIREEQYARLLALQEEKEKKLAEDEAKKEHNKEAE